jgi:hypothetical protein
MDYLQEKVTGTEFENKQLELERHTFDRRRRPVEPFACAASMRDRVRVRAHFSCHVGEQKNGKFATRRRKDRDGTVSGRCARRKTSLRVHSEPLREVNYLEKKRKGIQSTLLPTMV